MTLDPDRLRKLAETPTQDVLTCFPEQVWTSSKSLQWPGLMAWVQHGPAGELYVPPALLHTVIIKLNGPGESLQMRVAADGTEVCQRAYWGVGDICIVPAGEAAYYSREVDSDNLHINVEPGLLARYAAVHATATEQTLRLGSRVPVRDERMRILGSLVLELLRNPEGADALFIDTLGQTIAARLLGAYTGFLSPRASKRALDPSQVRRVCAFTDANLGGAPDAEGPGRRAAHERVAFRAVLQARHRQDATAACDGAADGARPCTDGEFLDEGHGNSPRGGIPEPVALLSQLQEALRCKSRGLSVDAGAATPDAQRLVAMARRTVASSPDRRP
ncbi:hypothetical protein LRS07_11600 [Aquabacterium sp. J223]|nr:hypothetical protein [Aquabacterium sp. J223]UUX94000.1 hypothetical protein LRS07_11600 [Aquabacterium sp. J223]